jgi:multidrug efflux pump subunit AcrB
MKGTIWNFFIEKRSFTYLIIAAVLVGGLVSVMFLPKEASPEVKIPIGVVNTFYPGASATDVERLITDKLETKIASLDDLDLYTSSSREGVSSITVQFNASADLDDRIRALRDAVSEAEPDLPSEVTRPFVQQISFSDTPIVTFSLTADVPDAELKIMAEAFKEELEKISGVSDVTVAGDREAELVVNVDKSKLDQYGLSALDVVSVLQTANVSSPVGSIQTDDVRYVVRLDAEIARPQAVADLPIRSVNGVPVYVRDVAQVAYTLAEAQTYSRVSREGEPSGNAVTLSVFKKTGGDITRIVDIAKENVETLRALSYSDANVVVVFDNAKEVEKSLSDLTGNAMQTIFIILLLLFLFLGWREALLAGISIPLTFLFGFIGLYLLGSSINFLSLFSLILSLGIVVDTGIVVVEGLHEELKKGTKPEAAAKKVVAEFQWPLISGTMTTVAAFIPMMFLSGIMGEFVKHIPITVTMTLVGSLFTGLALIPVLGTVFLKNISHETHKPTIKQKYIDPKMNRLHDWYVATLRSFLSDKRKKVLFSVVLGLGLFVALAMPITGVLKATLFPENNADFFSIDLEAPIGTTLAVTDTITRRIEDRLYEDPRIESFFVTVGSGNSMSGSVGTTANLATFTINLRPDRDERTGRILEEYRLAFADVTEADVTISQVDSGPPGGQPVAISFSGPELETLEMLAEESVGILESIEGAIDVGSSINESVLEFVITIDRDRAASNGLSAAQVAQSLRTGVQGTKAATLRYDGEDVEVNVRQILNPAAITPEDRTRTTIDEIRQMTLRSMDGRDVSLSSIATISAKPGTTSIQHTDGDRIATASASVSGTTAGEVFAAFSERAAEELTIPDGYTMKLGGESEEIEQTFRDLVMALIIGFFLIGSILLMQFNSFRQSFFILMSLPLALIAVLPGLALMGQTLSFPSFIGVISLSGVVVNDAIMLLDKINRNRLAGMIKFDAVIDAGRTRLQPILLTTVTTVAGILPLTLSDPVWGPLGFAIIFGLSFATVLTLFFLPMIYLKFGEKEIS